MNALYPDGSIPDNSEFIASLVDAAAAKLDIKTIIQFTNNGLYLMLRKKGHGAYWYMSWSASNPLMILAGNKEISLASPDFFKELNNSLIESAKLVSEYCECDECGY